MSTKELVAPEPTTRPCLPRPQDPIAREMAITEVLEDLANALAQGARALGVPALTTLGPAREIILTRRTYQGRFPPLIRQVQTTTGRE